MGRAPCCDKANVKKGPWSPEEDATLKAYIEKYGTGGNWIALPQKIGIKRCGKSCRLRWLNYLRPNIKHGGFTEEEDNIICSLYISIGSRWSIIAAQLPGRTDNDIKNYWNTRLKKKLLGRRKQAQMNRLSSVSVQDSKDDKGNGTGEADSTNYHDLQNLSSSALERLQLHMQLQSLQNPFSFYNNQALWPKLNSLQQKMMQTLHSLDGQNQNINPQLSASIAGLEQDFLTLSNLKADGLVNNSGSGGLPSSECSIPLNSGSSSNFQDSNIIGQMNAGIQAAGSGFTQGELDDLLNINNKVSNFLAVENPHQIGEFDCFKEMDVSRDSLEWWSNDFVDDHSASSSSWDSVTMLHHQSEEMYQNYDLGSYSTMQ